MPVDPLIIFCAQYLFIFVILLLLLAWVQAQKPRRKQMLLAVLIAGVIAVVLAKIVSQLYYDPRPFVSGRVKSLITHPADNGFPSEHTVLVMTLSAVLYGYRRKVGLIAFILSVLVGAGRVAAHVHSPIDIIGGTAIGIIAGWAGCYLAGIYLKNRQKAKKDSS